MALSRFMRWQQKMEEQSTQLLSILILLSYMIKNCVINMPIMFGTKSQITLTVIALDGLRLGI